MSNPFLRRATEFIRDDSAFLSVVSPEPLSTFVAKHPRKESLFDFPVRVIGTPGSGKTMMATLVEFRLVEAILRDQSSESNRALASALAASNFVDGDRPAVAAVRLPMESEYRDFWELPVPFEGFFHLFQRSHDAIDLRVPGVGHEQQLCHRMPSLAVQTERPTCIEVVACGFLGLIEEGREAVQRLLAVNPGATVSG